MVLSKPNRATSFDVIKFMRADTITQGTRSHPLSSSFYVSFYPFCFLSLYAYRFGSPFVSPSASFLSLCSLILTNTHASPLLTLQHLLHLSLSSIPLFPASHSIHITTLQHITAGFVHAISTGSWVLKRFRMDRAGTCTVLHPSIPSSCCSNRVMSHGR